MIFKIYGPEYDGELEYWTVYGPRDREYGVFYTKAAALRWIKAHF